MNVNVSANASQTARPAPAAHSSGWDPMDVDRQAVRDRAFRESRCFKCNEKGHKARNCRSPVPVRAVPDVEEVDSENE